MSDKTAEQWVMDGVDRAGVLAWMMPPVNQVRRAITGNTPSRHAAKRDILQFMEPAPLGYGVDVVTSAVGAVQGNESDTWRLLRAIPFANSFHPVDLLQTASGSRTKQKHK